MIAAALCAAWPLRSVPEEAAVGDVFGTLAVEVAVFFTRSSGMPNVSATICATFTNNPCPISMPPWFSMTEPSV